MIDALFGSKTRVKLLHLFLNNPGKSFYVREITRLVDEQINSVRRELANLLNVGVIVSQGSDNKLYYEANQKYQFFEAFSAIFVDKYKFKSPVESRSDTIIENDRFSKIKSVPGLRLLVASGRFVNGSKSEIDLLIVGPTKSQRLLSAISDLEKTLKFPINYSVLSYDDFYYRLSVKDSFISRIVEGDNIIIVDSEKLFNH